MMTAIKNSVFCCLLMAGLMAPPTYAGDVGAAMVAVQFQQGRGEQSRDRQNEGRGGRGAPAYPAQRREPPANPGNQGADRGGRQSRMTPDERRDLRRQIDEAGQDIYRRKR